MITSKYAVSFGQPWISLEKSSLQPGLQKPTTYPLYLVKESDWIGLPDRGQNLLIDWSIMLPRSTGTTPILKH